MKSRTVHGGQVPPLMILSNVSDSGMPGIVPAFPERKESEFLLCFSSPLSDTSEELSLAESLTYTGRR